MKSDPKHTVTLTKEKVHFNFFNVIFTPGSCSPFSPLFLSLSRFIFAIISETSILILDVIYSFMSDLVFHGNINNIHDIYETINSDITIIHGVPLLFFKHFGLYLCRML
jgi:hypothetical protein